MRIINADELEKKMYHEAFENDVSYDERNPMARWDSGLWIRYKMFENCLENTPTIDAADRPQGEWMSPTAGSYIQANFYKCSICGKIVNLLQMRNYKYCPNCGARMKG
jgi:rubrerythrin